jgi:hypothetical protein
MRDCDQSGKDRASRRGRRRLRASLIAAFIRWKALAAGSLLYNKIQEGWGGVKFLGNAGQLRYWITGTYCCGRSVMVNLRSSWNGWRSPMFGDGNSAG